MAKVNLLNEYGEFPVDDGPACIQYVSAADHETSVKRRNRRLKRKYTLEDEEIRMMLVEMVDIYGFKGLYRVSKGKLSPSTVRAIVQCSTKYIKTETKQKTVEVYDALRGAK